MGAESYFDIVSKVDLQEMNNAVQQTLKEIANRFDFKNSKSSITLEKGTLMVSSDDDYKLKSVLDILQTKMVKRGISLKNMEFDKIEPAASNTVRQKITLKQGIEQDDAKKINVLIRDAKLKVKSQILGDQIRVTGKSKDDLQQVIQLLRQSNLPLDLQFTNFK